VDGAGAEEGLHGGPARDHVAGIASLRRAGDLLSVKVHQTSLGHPKLVNREDLPTSYSLCLWKRSTIIPAIWLWTDRMTASELDPMQAQ
jgi:hypothetical protein